MKAPSARKESLILSAGLVWSITGLALMAVAISWLVEDKHIAPYLPLGIGIIGGIIVGLYGFSRLVKKNISRIHEQYSHKDRVCVFAFQSWRSYLIILVMMTMGYLLRHSLLPHIYLSPIYMAIGIGLLIAGIRYGLYYFKPSNIATIKR
jgi:hypothetical protein